MSKPLKDTLLSRQLWKSALMSATRTLSWGRFGPLMQERTVLRSSSTICTQILKSEYRKCNYLYGSCWMLILICNHEPLLMFFSRLACLRCWRVGHLRFCSTVVKLDVLWWSPVTNLAAHLCGAWLHTCMYVKCMQNTYSTQKWPSERVHCPCRRTVICRDPILVNLSTCAATTQRVNWCVRHQALRLSQFF